MPLARFQSRQLLKTIIQKKMPRHTRNNFVTNKEILHRIAEYETRDTTGHFEWLLVKIGWKMKELCTFKSLCVVWWRWIRINLMECTSFKTSWWYLKTRTEMLKLVFTWFWVKTSRKGWFMLQKLWYNINSLQKNAQIWRLVKAWKVKKQQLGPT